MKVDNRHTTAKTNLWCLVEGDKPLSLPTRKVSQEFWSENGEMSAMANARFSKMDCGHLPAYKVKQYIRRGSLVGVGSKGNAEMSRMKSACESPQNFGCLDECDQPLPLPTRYVSQQFVSEITLDTLDSDTSGRFQNDTPMADALFPKLDFGKDLPVHKEVKKQRSRSLGDLDVSSFAADKFVPVECAQPPHLPTRRLTGEHNISLEEESHRKFDAAVESVQPHPLPVRHQSGLHITSVDDLCHSSSASTRFTTETTDDMPPNLPENSLFYRNTSSGYLPNHKLKSRKTRSRKSC